MNRRLLAGVTLVMLGSTALSGAETVKLSSSGLNEKSDGGPGIYAKAAIESGALVTAEQAAAFPIAQRDRIHVLGGGVRGFGLLAEYSTAGERSFLIARRTAPSSQEPYTPVALGRVFDPDGNLVSIEDFTDQSQETEVRILKVPTGKPGIWRVSFSGGRSGDLVELRLPVTPTWGVRGEMALSISATTPKPAYLWIPPTARKLRLGIEMGRSQGIAIKSLDGKLLAEGSSSSTKCLLVDPVSAGTVYRVDFPESYEGTIDFEGAPGLLCPNENAARKLAGGTINCNGVFVMGPLQARARRWMLAHPIDRNPPLTWPQSVPTDLTSPQRDVLLFGKYGGLNGLGSSIKAQNETLDPKNPYFGIPWPTGLKAGAETRDSWINFLPYADGFVSLYDSTNYALLYSYQSQLNPVYHNEHILNRSILAAFFHISSLQGDDLIRDNTLMRGSYPITHTFFIYDGLASSYRMLRDSLPPEPREIWRQALLAIGDKVADHQAYESNQWAHMMHAHLDTYLATGEKRFLRNFETQMTAYLSGAYGTDAKFGQHPAGYFLEEYGPDGNYDRLNLYAVTASYNDYKKLPEAKQLLVTALRQGIEKNLQFKSFFWLPQPDNSLHSPTALNCRTGAMFCFSGYPGEYLARKEFATASARVALDVEPSQGIGLAATNSFTANTPAWIQRTLEQGVAWGPDYYPNVATGDWVENLSKVSIEKSQIAPAVLPFQQQQGFWDLPGFFAWKQGSLYGMTFYDVEGTKRPLVGVTGGGPTALWSPATGTFLASMHPNKSGKAGHLSADTKTILAPDQLTYSCVYGLDENGAFFASGHERARVQSRDPSQKIEISSKISTSILAALVWTYRIQENGADIGVSLKSIQPVREAWVNLPILVPIGQTTATLEGKSRLVVSTARGSAVFTWPDSIAARLEDSCLPDIKRLVIALPQKGVPVTISVRVLEKGSTSTASQN